jgi:hypothetical protein
MFIFDLKSRRSRPWVYKTSGGLTGRSSSGSYRPRMCECKNKVLGISSPFDEIEKSHVQEPKGVTGPKYIQKHYSAVFHLNADLLLVFPVCYSPLYVAYLCVFMHVCRATNKTSIFGLYTSSK